MIWVFSVLAQQILGLTAAVWLIHQSFVSPHDSVRLTQVAVRRVATWAAIGAVAEVFCLFMGGFYSG